MYEKEIAKDKIEVVQEKKKIEVWLNQNNAYCTGKLEKWWMNKEKWYETIRYRKDCKMTKIKKKHKVLKIIIIVSAMLIVLLGVMRYLFGNKEVMFGAMEMQCHILMMYIK